MIRNLTEKYVDAFNSKNIEGVANLLHDDVVLTDPNVEQLSPKETVIAMISNLFANIDDTFSFVAKLILVQDHNSVIEFVLTIDKQVFIGVDLIQWEGNKIKKMVAYLYERK